MKKKNDSQILIERANQREKEAIERINSAWNNIMNGIFNSTQDNGENTKI